MKPSPFLLTLFLALPAAYGGEFKVEKKPFKSTVGFEGSFLPAEALVIKVDPRAVSYTHLRAHETPEHLVFRLLH
mgnify:CR=1 FL=1